jgi:hypothetical protein
MWLEADVIRFMWNSLDKYYTQIFIVKPTKTIARYNL